MAKSLKVRVITKEEQEEKYKMIVYLFVVGALIFLLYLAYNYIRTLGFNHNSTIALIISIPVILLVFIFKSKKIYWAIKSLSQDNYHKNKYKKQNRKGFFWLLIITLLILVVLFLQFYPSIPNKINSITENSQTIKEENSFIELANQRDYPKVNVLTDLESKEICSLKCEGNLMSYTSDTSNFYVIECDCGRINSLSMQVEVEPKNYYLDLKTLKEITREEFLLKIGK